MKYLVQFEKSEQITEDSWRISRPSLEVDVDETLADILKWVISKNSNRMPEKIEIRELNVISRL